MVVKNDKGGLNENGFQEKVYDFSTAAKCSFSRKAKLRSRTATMGHTVPSELGSNPGVLISLQIHLMYQQITF